jgi:rhamnose transport system permease protein
MIVLKKATIALQQRNPFPYPHEAIMAALAVSLVLTMWFIEPAFLSWPTQRDLSTHVWELALLSIPMTLVIITAGIDLSIGSAMALSAVVLGLCFERGMSPWTASLLAVMAGMAAGALNGFFIAWIRVHPLIVTLATLAAFRGIAEGISLGRPISGFPESFAMIGRGQAIGIPIPGIIVLVAALAAIGILWKTPLGRYIYALGHNETGTRFSGIPVQRIKFLLYTVSGTCAGLCAVLYVARRNTAKADIAMGMELDVITAVVLGGTSIFGGRGTIIGTLLGVFMIHEVREFVSWRWNQDELNFVVIGTLLIVAVLVNKFFARKNAA